MVTAMPADYQMRAELYGFASPDEVRQVMADSHTYILDARTPEEVAETGHVHGSLQTSCTAVACPQLSMEPQSLVPDKTANIVIYCKSGRRASRAKEILMEQGYTGKILNAGGYDDMLAILAEQ